MPHHAHDPYGPQSPYVDYDTRTVSLDVTQFRQDLPIGAGVLQSMRAELIPNAALNHAMMRVSGWLLTEQLPPVDIDDRQAFTVPRFATWWDHFKATHWNRGPMWWLRDFGWIKPPRYIDEPHTHTTTVTVRGRWTYPRATTVAPGNSFGHVVYKSDTMFRGSGVRPW